MTGVGHGSYWSIVKANIASGGAAREDELNVWWNDHASEYVAKDGFTRGWRMRAAEHEAAVGSAPHTYHAVYEVDEIASFNRALDKGTQSHPGDPWGPWQAYVDEYLLDWERTYYRILHREQGQPGSGSWWACVKVDLGFRDNSHEREFDDWYTTTHMPEICSYPGIHRGWRLEVEADDNDLGPRRQRFWGVYEVSSPAHFAAARQDRADRGIEPWDGIWLPFVSNFEISFYELLHAVDQHEAHPEGGRT